LAIRLGAGHPENGLSVTRMAQLRPNSVSSTQEIVLRVRVNPRRGRRIGVTEPLRDHATVLNNLATYDKTFGLETMCVGGGQGMAMVIERLA
jgi:acetyl-CoA acetyltransferase